MTGDSARARAGETEAEPGEYETMLETLDVAIAEAKEKIESGRVYDVENEKVRIKWIRALAYAVNVRRQVTQDRDLEELTDRVNQLETMQNRVKA